MISRKKCLITYKLDATSFEKPQFSPRNQANPGEVSMNLESLTKIINSILYTLPRILAPLEAIPEKLTTK